MDTATRRNAGGVLRRLGWWALFLIVVVYGVFALAMGFSEFLFVLGVSAEVKHRATPVIFAIHALAGATVLLIGPLQSFRGIRRRPAARRALGRTYVVAVWIASATAVVDAMAFGVSVPAKIVFVGVAAIWFATTTIGMLRARARRFADQHEWMVRSYSLSLFFVTFSLWVPAMASTSLPPSVGYPLALVLSAALNLGAAEFWIRWTRKTDSLATVVTARTPVADAFAR
jgi:Predicted membrane protein (DUF2306)